MGRIHILPDPVKRAIAAGEVIEGPFSVIKELIENALDAGARHVDIAVAESGMKRIFVRDDGEGISREDVPLAVVEHATSKITDIHDIGHIRSFGFRGEALSSMSAVSRFTLLSRCANEQPGARVDVTGSTFETGEYAGPAGTTVIVENLFYNVPARKKFLKSAQAELRLVREAVIRAAIPAHETEFSFEVDGRRTIHLPAVSSLHERISQVLGKELASNLFHETLDDIKVQVTGFLSGPGAARGNRSLQYLYVNGRPVDYRYLGFLLSRGYESYLPQGKYPVAVIFIDLAPELVDVNIHPAKREVKFFDSRYIDSLILGLIDKALTRQLVIRPDNVKPIQETPSSSPASDADGTFPDMGRIPAAYRREDFTFRVPAENIHGQASAPGYAEEPGMPEGIRDGQPVSVLGEALGTYIVFEEGDKLKFMDFHAAHERILYDTLLEKNEDPDVQELIFPETMELSVEEYGMVMDNVSAFRDFGFDIDDFGERTVVIRSVPAVTGGISPDVLVRSILDELKDDRQGDFRKSVLAGVACHAARRAGDVLSRDEMMRLVREVLSGQHALRCPHGRPFIYSLEKNDLERLFRRQ